MPLRLSGMVTQVRAAVREHGPLTVPEIAAVLKEKGVRWPLPPDVWGTPRSGDPTPARVRTVVRRMHGRGLNPVRGTSPEKWDLTEKWRGT
jgi:hypothetical protein